MNGLTLLTNHGLALLCVARDPDVRIRDLAVEVDVTERTAHRLITDLIEAGHIERARIGRRNRYQIIHETAMRHPLTDEHWIGELLAVLTGPPNRRADHDTAETADDPDQ